MKRRVSGWSFRLLMHERDANSAYFITLTYSTKNVPITDNGFMSLCKSDLQKYMKRLRKFQYERTPDMKVNYYAVGEYGSKTQRPHYHLIIFNADLDLIEKAWKLQGNEIGNIHCGAVSGASIGYTLKYLHKQNEKDYETGQYIYKVGTGIWDEREPEFQVMSKGIGESYVNEKTKKWHKAKLTERYYLPYEGKKLPMPRYYKQRIYTEEELKIIGRYFKKQRELEEQEENEKEYDQRLKAQVAETRRYKQSLKIDKL